MRPFRRISRHRRTSLAGCPAAMHRFCDGRGAWRRESSAGRWWKHCLRRRSSCRWQSVSAGSRPSPVTVGWSTGNCVRCWRRLTVSTTFSRNRQSCARADAQTRSTGSVTTAPGRRTPAEMTPGGRASSRFGDTDFMSAWPSVSAPAADKPMPGPGRCQAGWWLRAGPAQRPRAVHAQGATARGRAGSGPGGSDGV